MALSPEEKYWNYQQKRLARSRQEKGIGRSDGTTTSTYSHHLPRRVEDEDDSEGENEIAGHYGNPGPISSAPPMMPYPFQSVPGPSTALQHPLQYPYPLMLYPTPVLLPPPPNYHTLPKTKKTVRYAQRPEYLHGRTPTAWVQDTEDLSGTSVQLDHIVPQTYNPFDPRQNRLLQKYDMQLAAASFQRNDEFAKRFVCDFVDRYVEEDMVPDILMDAVMDTAEPMSPEHPCYWPALDIATDVLNQDLLGLIRSVVLECTNEMVAEYFDGQRVSDPVHAVCYQIMAEVVQEQCRRLVPDTLQELVSAHLEKARLYDTAMSMVGEVLEEWAPKLLDEVKAELMEEEWLEMAILQPEVSSLCRDVAVETRDYYGGRVRQAQQKQIRAYADRKLLDSFLAGSLAELLGKQSQVWARKQEEHKILDMTVLDILLEQYFSILQCRQSVLDNKPMRRYQEKCFTDVALDVVLGELALSLDEDLADLDEYEQGLWDPMSQQPPDWALER